MAKVRLLDIAERLGVSTVTVHNALSGAKGVSSELRGKILETAEEMGYHRTSSGQKQGTDQEDPAERLQSQEQRFEPLDTSKIDLDDLAKKGIRMEDIEPHLRAMSYGHKSNGLVDMNPELESGLRVLFE